MFDSVPEVALRAVLRVSPVRQAVVPRMSTEAAHIVSIGDRAGWPFRVLGRHPMITEPLFTGSWWVMPIQSDTGPIPRFALDRVRGVFENGGRPTGFVIAHETPRLLTAKASSAQPAGAWWRRHILVLASHPGYLGLIAIGLAIVGPFLLGLLIKAVIAAAAMLVIPLAILGLGAVAVSDPVLIAVTDDNVWIEIARWA